MSWDVLVPVVGGLGIPLMVLAITGWQVLARALKWRYIAWDIRRKRGGA